VLKRRSNDRARRARARIVALPVLLVLGILVLVSALGELGQVISGPIGSAYLPLLMSPLGVPSATPTATATISITVPAITQTAMPTANPTDSGYPPVIIDGPWTELPADADPNVVLDTQTGALTLRTVMTDTVFLLEPDTSKSSAANTVRDMMPYDGRLYLGYGDLVGNAGPIDVVSYDPETGILLREMLQAPDEQIGNWSIGPRGRLYVSGEDARESWTFGNFYVKDGLGWEKRRTIFEGVHVARVVEAQGKLYAGYGDDGTSPVSYPHILVSDNGGVTWEYESIASGEIRFSAISDLAVVPHTDGMALYVLAYNDGWHVYRSFGQDWTELPNPGGGFIPTQLLTFGDHLLIRGNKAVGTVYALDGHGQMDVAYLRGKEPDFERFVARDGWLYTILRDEACMPSAAGYSLHRTQDLVAWEKVGCVSTSPGSTPKSIAFLCGRLYLGTGEEGAGLCAAVNAVESAEYVSAVFSVAPLADGAKLYSDVATPPATSIQFQVRTGRDGEDLHRLPFLGPDGSSSSYYEVSGTPLWGGHWGDTRLQYRGVLASQNPAVAPFLHKVVLDSGDASAERLSVEASPTTWTAGTTGIVTVTARSESGDLLPIAGMVALSAQASVSGEAQPMAPAQVRLVEGRGSAKVSLERMGSTLICARLGDIFGCSSEILVEPGPAAAIIVSTDLIPPRANWSETGAVGVPFDVSLEIRDRYGNRVIDYRGNVTCECWRAVPVADVVLPVYTFQAEDLGYRQFPGGAIIPHLGEWNIACYESRAPGIAGATTINMVP